MKKYPDWLIYLWRYLNFNTIFLVLTGLLLMIWGIWRLYRFRDYQFGGAVFLVGVGNTMFGITNGFSDSTPRGRLFFRIGVMSYVIGFGAVAYTYRYLFM